MASGNLHHNPNGKKCYHDDGVKCTICDKNCCYECYALNVGIADQNHTEYQCKDCFVSNRYQIYFGITKLIYTSLFRGQAKEMNIIQIITNYAMEDRVKCNHNDCNNLQNEIVFNKQMTRIITSFDQHFGSIFIKESQKVEFYCIHCDNKEMDALDINKVMKQASCNKTEAILALRSKNGDIVEAVMLLVLGF